MCSRRLTTIGQFRITPKHFPPPQSNPARRDITIRRSLCHFRSFSRIRISASLRVRLRWTSAYRATDRKITDESPRAIVREPIQRRPDACGPAVQHVRVDHRRPDVAMSQELLDCPDVVAVLEEMRGEGVPERRQEAGFVSPASRTARCTARCITVS